VKGKKTNIILVTQGKVSQMGGFQTSQQKGKVKKKEKNGGATLYVVFLSMESPDIFVRFSKS